MECDKCQYKDVCPKAEDLENDSLKDRMDFKSIRSWRLNQIAFTVVAVIVLIYIFIGLQTVSAIAFNHGSLYGIAAGVMDVVVAIVLGLIIWT